MLVEYFAQLTPDNRNDVCNQNIIPPETWISLFGCILPDEYCTSSMIQRNQD